MKSSPLLGPFMPLTQNAVEQGILSPVSHAGFTLAMLCRAFYYRVGCNTLLVFLTSAAVPVLAQ